MNLKFKPNSKQLLACEKWIDKTTIEICFGGAKYGGKSFLGATLIFGDALIYPDTFYFIARKQLNDLRKYTAPTIGKVFQQWDIKLTQYTTYNGQDHYYQCYNGSRIYLLECTELPSDPMFERFGSIDMTRGWIEEGGEINSLAKENLKTAVGRKNNNKYDLYPKLLITCNPKKNFLYSEFYKPFMDGTLPPDKAFIQAYAHDNIYGDQNYIKSLNNIKDRIMYERLVMGNWEYDDDQNALIDFDSINDLFTNTHVPEGMKYITADIARFGRDKTVIIVWSGWRVIRILSIDKNKVTEAAEAIKKLKDEYKIPASQIICDADGVGSGVVDILACKEFTGNAVPFEVHGKKENYQNCKSQFYFNFAEKICRKEVFIATQSETAKRLITEELEQVKQKNPDGDGKRAIISKDEVKRILGRSPDYSDAMMLRYYFELKPGIIKPATMTYVRA